jgi:hypothetical protein
VSRNQPITNKPPLSREEEADRALRNTEIGPGWAWGASAAFLCLIVAVPLMQLTMDMREGSGQPPSLLRVFKLLPSLRDVRSARTPGRMLALLPQEQAIRDYEDDLDANSVLTRWALPPMQVTLALAGAGNEQAYCGAEGWLFYRPDVDYVTGRGFLDPEVLRTRARKGEGQPVQPDPIPAIALFARQLKERGIELVVMPAPSKPMVQPEKLNPGFSSTQDALQNPSYSAFCDALRRNGVRLFDPTGVLIEAKRRTGRPQFLQTDTHWTPEAMELVADALARHIHASHLLPEIKPVAYQRRTETIENLGDIALMLKLPPGQTLYSSQRVSIHPVYGLDGAPWRPRKDADVLLMGDSYTGIYSLAGMGWGGGAGLAEQLCSSLQRPLDRIAINAGGSHATREQLLREMARGKDRLKGKRLVIWEFAMRDLMEGDWKLLSLPDARPSAAGTAPGIP